MVTVVAKNTVKQENIQEFITIAKTLVEATNKLDDGCIRYDLYQDCDEPNVLTFIEEWESFEALEAHMKAEHFLKIVPQMSALAEAQEDVRCYNRV